MFHPAPQPPPLKGRGSRAPSLVILWIENLAPKMGGGARRTRRGNLKMRCSIARTARASNAPRCRPLFPDWDRACSAHLEGNRRGALDPNSPDFTGAARQHLPKDAGPRGFMPREQCEAPFASPGDVEGLRHHRTFSTMIWMLRRAQHDVSPFIEAAPAAPADVSTFQSVRSSSKPSRVETRRMIRLVERGEDTKFS